MLEEIADPATTYGGDWFTPAADDRSFVEGFFTPRPGNSVGVPTSEGDTPERSRSHTVA